MSTTARQRETEGEREARLSDMSTIAWQRIHQETKSEREARLADMCKRVGQRI